MKQRLNYKSRKTIIIVAIIIALLAIASTGIYMFTKGNDEAKAFTEGNTTIGGQEANEGTPGNTNNPTTGDNPEEQQPVEPNIEPEQGSQNNNNNGETQTNPANNNLPGNTTNTNTRPNQNGTTTTTTGNVPNQEYVTERQEEVEKVSQENFLVGWAPISLAAMTQNIGLNKVDEEPAYTVSKVATLINGEEIQKDENGEIKTKVKTGDTVTYKITVTNRGNVTLQNIQVIDELANYEKTIAVLAIGDSEELDVVYTVKQEDITKTDSIINTVKVIVPEITDPENPVKDEEEIPANPYITVSGEKTWVAPEGTKYPTITINLLRDGEKIDSKELVNGETTYAFENLYKYDETDAHEYLYEVTENDVEGYTKSQEEYNFTNTIRTDLSYTVNYLEKGTNTVLNTAKTVDNQTFGAEVTEKAIEIEGYNKVAPTEETIKIKIEGNVINFYYTKRADLSYTVNYLEKDTNKVLSTAKIVGNQTFGAEVKEEAIEIEGYNKVAPTEETITIKVEGNVIDFYYTKRADLSYTVNYLEKDTDKVLAEAKTVNGKTYKEEVTETAKEITGYTVDAETKNITIEVENNVINFYYTKRADLSYTVNYLEKDTDKVLAEAKTVNGKTYKEEVTETAKEVTGYTVDAETKNITIEVENNVINFYYTKRADLSYTVNYLEKDTNKVLSTAKTVGNQIFGTEVKEEAIEIEGYNKVAPTEETITIKVEGNVINFYYTKRADLSYTVNYLEKDTNKVLSTAKTVNNQTFGTEVTEKAIEVTGYTVDAETKNITIEVQNNVINFYYQKAKFNYTVKYYYEGILDDTKTESILATYEDKITTYEDKCITGYILKETKNLPLTVSEIAENNIIEVYYVKDSFEYKVEYYYDGKIDNSKTVQSTAKYGDKIESYTDKNITGYKLERTEKLPLTISPVVEENVIKIFYEKANYEYTIQYYYDGTIDESKTEKLSAKYQSVIENIDTDKNKTEGYVLEKVEGTPLTITAIVSKNVIKVYYSKPNITITKSAVSKANAGSEITYTITLTNKGKVEGQTTVTDTLPESLTYISADNGATQENKVITWANVTVPANSTKVLTVKAKVNENTIGSTITNNVTTSQDKTDSAITTVNELTIKTQEITQGETGKDSVNVVLVMDLSYSMYGERLTAAKTAAQNFIRNIYVDGKTGKPTNSKATVTVITFNTKDPVTTGWVNKKEIPYTGTKILGTTVDKNNYSTLVNEIGAITLPSQNTSSGLGTNVYEALNTTKNTIYGTNGLNTQYPNNKNVVIFLGDGEPTTSYSGNEYSKRNENYPTIEAKAKEIKDNKADIYSIGFGEDATKTDSKAYKLLKKISSNNVVYTANDATELSKVFTNLQEAIKPDENTSTKGKNIVTLSKELVVDANSPIIVKIGEKEVFKCTDKAKLSEYCLSYENKTLTWDVNAWNSKTDVTKVTSGEVMLSYYVER